MAYVKMASNQGLLRACLDGLPAIAEWAKEHGPVNVDLALEAACFAGHRFIAEWAIAEGAGKTLLGFKEALNAACFSGQQAIAEWLVTAHGAVDDFSGAFYSARAGAQQATAEWALSRGGINIDLPAELIEALHEFYTPRVVLFINDTPRTDPFPIVVAMLNVVQAENALLRDIRNR